MSMTIAAIQNLHPTVAAGLLARMALALSDETNPAAKFVLPGEAAVRAEVLSEIRNKLGFSETDSHLEAEKIADVLDHESDLLAEPVDSKAALDRLSRRGDLPTDLYHVVIDPQLEDLYEHRQFDVELVLETVRAPDRTQHFTPSENGDEAPLVSIFAKHFSHKFSNLSFTLLVTGIRSGSKVYVSQAWRIYADRPVEQTMTLVDLLRNFIEDFGLVIRVGERKIKFLTEVVTQGRLNDEFQIDFLTDNKTAATNKNGQRKFYAAHHGCTGPDGREVSRLIYAIDLIKYKSRLRLNGWEREKPADILNSKVGPLH